MEDYFDITFHCERMAECTTNILPVHYFGVFDGHGGQKTARYLSESLIEAIVQQPTFTEGALGEAVESGFATTDSTLVQKAARSGPDDGSCCCSVFLRGSSLMVANVGDSRAVLCSGGVAVALSNDHKPNRPDERRRVQSHGGFVQTLGVPRVNGVLAVSRAFGDSSLKPYITAAPEIAEVELGAIGEDEFVVVGSDGLWDVIGNQECVDLAAQAYKKERDWELVAKALTDTAIRKGSADNITVIVLSLDFRQVTDS